MVKPSTSVPRSSSAGASVDSQLAQISTELRNKPGTFAILGLMLAAVAIPTGLVGTWFTREVDAVQRSLDEIAKDLKETKDAVLATKANTDELEERLDSLVVAMARSVALPVKGQEKMVAFQRLVPSDVFDALKRDKGDLSYIRHVVFDERNWVFISSEDLNALSSELQGKLKDSFSNMNVRFEVEMSF